MSEIDEIQEKLNSANTKLDLVASSVTAIGKDVGNLTAQITALSAGAVTDEQLDQLKSAANSISDKVASVGADLVAIDAETPDEE